MGNAHDAATDREIADNQPMTAWDVDAIQFPRLLAEIQAAVQFSDDDWAALAESMDLTREDIVELFDRAVRTGDAIAAVTRTVR